MSCPYAGVLLVGGGEAAVGRKAPNLMILLCKIITFPAEGGKRRLRRSHPTT